MVELLYIVASIHIILCPFTKVEESFNIQACHDILYHRHNLTQYDHNEFPGVVPRTFIGPAIISILSSPIVGALHLIGVHKFWMQYVVRLALALAVILSWCRLRNALQKQFGSTFTWWFSLITVTQYHFMFYLSRPLPNIMALPLVLLAFEAWISGKHKQFVVTAGASIVIFRSELAMLFGLFLVIDLYFKKIDIPTLFKIILPAGIGLVALTVCIDSIFWGRLLWPEAEVFWYNTILNKSSDWGTSPFLWYFYSALPRGLGPSLILIPVGIYLDKRLTPMIAPALVYILLYSLLPHKELRFIIYVFPLLNMSSAAVCSYVFIRRSKAPIYELLFWGIVIIVVGNILLSVAFVLVAMNNYPGGLAITRLHKLLRDEPFVHVHISNLAAQTGVTRFTQINNNWKYSKNESLQPEQLQQYTHLLVEAKSKYSPNVKAFANTHVVLDSVDSFSQVAMNYKLLPPIRIKTKPAIFILERKNFRTYPYGQSIQVSDDSTVMYDDNSMQSSNEETLISDSAYENGDYEEIDQIIGDQERQEFSKQDQTEDNKEESYILNTINSEIEQLDLPKAKKIFDELKSQRQERKKKAIEKIKSETRKEVVASAKEKLKDIMKRHKHIAEELSENIISVDKVESNELYDRGDIPEEVIALEIENSNILDEENKGITEPTLTDDKAADETENRTNENINTIVDEVIKRLIEKKIYDDKTKPEDIKAEDRQIIQKIVEEVLSEKMNFTKSV